MTFSKILESALLKVGEVANADPPVGEAAKTAVKAGRMVPIGFAPGAITRQIEIARLRMPGRNPNAGPILPKWATDATINKEMTNLMYEIRCHGRYIDHQVMANTASMIDEAEAMLRHESEGW